MKLSLTKPLFSSLVIAGFLMTVSLAQGQDSTPEPTPTPAHWTYEGDEGPSHWGQLDSNYALCGSGRAQSPVDLTAPQDANLTDIAFNYQSSALNIFNNGHTIQVNYDAGSSITYNEISYTLKQFHFHHPSEHTVNGRQFDMELHLVHQDPISGNLAVVGVLLQMGEQDNPAYQAMLDNLPTAAGTPIPTTLSVNAADLLPESHLYDTYIGSLTTPPCTQGVRWLVLTQPVQLSAHQIEAFAAIFEDNARPVQPLNQRDLLEDNSSGS